MRLLTREVKNMYNTHAIEISEHALKTPKGLLDVITFTFSTITAIE